MQIFLVYYQRESSIAGAVNDYFAGNVRSLKEAAKDMKISMRTGAFTGAVGAVFPAVNWLGEGLINAGSGIVTRTMYALTDDDMPWKKKAEYIFDWKQVGVDFATGVVMHFAFKGITRLITGKKTVVEGGSGTTQSLQERYPHWYDANGKYTGGRTQEALDALAFDPHKGKITSGSIIERDVILALEEQGYLEHAIRDTWGKGDFYDDIMLKLYDIKSFESFPLDNLGKPITNVNGGAFDVNKAMRNIIKEFDKNSVDYVIINTKKMNQLHINQLKQQIELKGLLERVIWY